VTKPFVETHQLAAVLLVASAVFLLLAESAATYAGQARTSDARGLGRLRLGGRAVLEAVTAQSGTGAEDRGTKLVLFAGLFGGFTLGWYAAQHLPSAALSGNGWIYVGAGVATVWLGVSLRAWAVLTLGRYFRREVHVEAGHQVVRSGPYRFVRHPAYLGNVLATLGVGIALANWLSIAALLVLPLLAHVPRIVVEERALKDQIGAPYEEFTKQTARVIPGVW